VLFALACCFVYVPTWVVFLPSRGCSLQDVMVLKAVMSLTTLVVEVPSGYFADRFGRKTAIILCGLINCLALASYYFGDSFIFFLFGEVLLGMGFSIISGADKALIYDSLAQIDSSGLYLKVQSRLNMVAGWAEAVGGLLAAAMVAWFSLSAPYLFQLLLFVLFTILACKLKEPPRNREATPKGVEAMTMLYRETFKESKVVRWLLLLSASTGSATFLIVWMGQAAMSEAKFSAESIALIWSGLHFWLGFCAYLSPVYEKCLGMRGALRGIALLTPLSYFFLGFIDHAFLIVLLIFFVYFTRGVQGPLLSSYINLRIGSALRASILSVASLLRSICFVVIAPIIGWVGDTSSTGAAFLVAGLFFATTNAIALSRLFYNVAQDKMKEVGSDVPHKEGRQ